MTALRVCVLAMMDNMVLFLEPNYQRRNFNFERVSVFYVVGIDWNGLIANQ